MIRIADALGLHKSATFNATVTIHELTQVPLLNAKFRIKWKFKGATTSSHSGAETPTDDAASNQSASGGGHHHLHGLASRWLHPRSALSSSTSVNGISSASSTSTTKAGGSTAQQQRQRSPSGSGSRFERSSSDSDQDDEIDFDSEPPASPPTRNGLLSPAPNDPGRTPNPNRTPGPNFAGAFAPSSAGGSDARNVEASYSSDVSIEQKSTERENAAGTSSARRRGMSEVSLGASPTSPSPTRSVSVAGPEPRGKTAVVSLRSHTATFNREVSCPVSISLRSDADSKKYRLQPSPVRLSVRQQNMGEEHKLEEEKLGEVVLDLSQFVPRHGRSADLAKPRRYLLQGCKSNAVLRVSVKMEWLDGAQDYVAPPLKSGHMSSTSSSTGLKALTALHGAPANRSAVSLGKNPQSNGSTSRLSTGNHSQVASSNASTSLSRTNSISSNISSPSATRSTPSPERARTRYPQTKKNGWHPPHSALTSAAVPMILGSCGTTQSNDQRSAPEIIDTLFNRPASPVNGRTSWRDPRPPAHEGRLGEAFEYRPGPPSREMSAQTDTGASTSGGGGGGRFSRARKAWSIRSARNSGKGASTSGGGGSNAGDARVDFDRDQPEVPIAASYAQTEAPAERKRQKERDGLLHDVTHDLGARWKAKRQGSTDSTASGGPGGHGTTHHAPSVKPKMARRPSNPLRRRADSTASTASSSTETEQGAASHLLLGAPSAHPPPPASRRPSFPASVSSRPVSIRWEDQDQGQHHDAMRRRTSNASLAAALPRSILGLGLSEDTAARAAEQPYEAQARPASAISFESLVTPPSPAA
ncbi:hypothetical protein JCM3774_001340 [Rhodotorula dairenensis]